MDYIWTEQQRNKKLNQTLKLLESSNDPITLAFTVAHESSENKSNLISIIRGIGIDDNIVNLTTAEMIYEKYGEPSETKNHKNYSFELKYPNVGMSFFYKIDDPIKIIYLMMATGERPCETETGLIFDLELTLEHVFSYYGISDPKGTDNSDEAFVHYSGILFYAKKNDLTQLQADQVYISKIGVLQL